jgi:ATP-binding cassette, subfamily B, bacterial
MKNSYLNLIINFWNFSEKKQKRKLLLAGVMFVFANLVDLSKPMILALMLNEIQKGIDATLFAKIFTYLLVYAGATLGFWLLHGPARVIERIASFEATKNYTDFLYGKIASLPLKWHRDHHSGYTIDRMRKSIDALQRFSQDSYNYIQSAVRLLGSFAVILWIFPSSAFIALIFSVFVLFGNIWFNRRIVKLTKKLNQQQHYILGTLFDYVSNISTVLTLNLQKLTRNEFVQKIAKMKADFSARAKINEWKWFSVSMVVEILIFIILLWFLFLELHKGGVILIGTLVALFQYTDRFVSTFFNFTYQHEELLLMDTDFRTAEGILVDCQKLQSKKKTQKIPKIFQEINISDLCFTHSDEKKQAHHIKNISLQLKKGKRIAFVGESGSGKSTLMILLRGLESPQQAKLFVDEKEIADFSALSAYSTLIPQDSEIFENTIHFNITFELSDPQRIIDKALRISNFKKVLDRLPKGLKSDIKEKGVNLSGGEKQRLALARGIFAALQKKSKILLLDEPTSSVDPKNESEIYNNILNEFSDICVISSLHKLHLCRRFDEICFFQNGEIIERGTFDELISQKGEFFELWQKQQS